VPTLWEPVAEYLDKASREVETQWLINQISELTELAKQGHQAAKKLDNKKKTAAWNTFLEDKTNGSAGWAHKWTKENPPPPPGLHGTKHRRIGSNLHNPSKTGP
jgi:hypothetical protein